MASSDVFSFREIARAARVPIGQVRQLHRRGEIRTVGPDDAFVRYSDALQVIDRLSRVEAGRGCERDLLTVLGPKRRAAGLPLLLSGTLHGAFVLTAVILTSLGLTAESTAVDANETPEQMRLVFIALPGPGGGGGGGGLRQKAPPPKAERKGERRLSSPLPARQAPEPIVAVTKPEEPKPEILTTEPLPPVMAPIAVSAADMRDRAGDLKQTSSRETSRGPGQGGGVGSGEGTGLGEGQGSGVGPGSGGGTGGGPYRPGSGIAPPRLLREVKADYTEEARQRGLRGEVLLEIVVRRDGNVGDVRVLRGLGAGLDERAIEAVRQWRFAPARRSNTPVDVIVEVAVEFKLR